MRSDQGAPSETKAVKVSLLPDAGPGEAFAQASRFRGELFGCLTAHRRPPRIRLPREAAADLRRPWEKPAEPGRLPAARVRRGYRSLRPHLHCPARAPEPSTPVPVSPLGSRNRRPATRYDVDGFTTPAPSSAARAWYSYGTQPPSASSSFGTKRSWVQIPPPRQLSSRSEGPYRIGKGPLALLRV